LNGFFQLALFFQFEYNHKIAIFTKLISSVFISIVTVSVAVSHCRKKSLTDFLFEGDSLMGVLINQSIHLTKSSLYLVQSSSVLILYFLGTWKSSSYAEIPTKNESNANRAIKFFLITCF
jgi:hypothetical protein